jgi:predicted permease
MGLKHFFRRAQWDRIRRDEMETYLQIETDENVARGMQYDEALAAARRQLGNSTLVREEIYRMNTMTFFDRASRDIRYAFRQLRNSPTFTAVALLTLAIGIGANTAVFSVVNSVLLRPLAYPQPNELVSLHQLAPGSPGIASFSEGLLLSPSMYVTYSDHNRTFQSLGVWATERANVTGLAAPEQVRVIAVSSGILESLAVPPALGRWLSNADQIPHAPETVMLSYGYWQRHFGGSPSVIGRVIQVDSRSRQIVGVMPRGFRVVSADFDLIQPLAFDRGKLILAGFGFQGLGRLKPGVTIAQANADLHRMLSVWMDSWSNGIGDPHYYENWKITPAIRPLKDEIVGRVGDLLWVVMGTIGLVMLIACANVTNLLLVRTEARQQELAVRAALGAGWARILQEILVESALLGFLGGIVAVGLAYEGLKLLVAIGPANIPRLDEISLDARALAFTFLLCLLSSILTGLIPALKHAGPRISLALRGAGRNASMSRERHRTRNILVVAQVALALVLMVSAGLMIRTFETMRTVKPGFTGAAQLQTMRISIPEQLISEPERVTRTQNAILEKLAAIPGVDSAAFISELPMEGFTPNWDNIFAEGKNAPNEVVPMRAYKFPSPGYFQTAGTRILAGRDFAWADLYNQHPVVILSDNLARELWGSPSAAIGKRVREFPSMPWHEVIGVVEDTRENGIQDAPPAIVYWPPLMPHLYGSPTLESVREVTFAIRSQHAGTAALIQQVEQAVWSVESNLPVASPRTMQDIYDRSLSRTSFTLVMLIIAGAMALVLGVIGIYGVISYTVSQRTREIGIRLALGAQHQELKTMFVRSGLSLAAIGAVIGLAIAAGLTRLMKSLLFGISPLDPLTYAIVPVVLALAAILASYLPARRAASVDPVEALKAE